MTNPQYAIEPRTGGFALVLSLLFTGIVLLIVVSTAASLATGSRRGGADERQAYQALLVAESGLNSLSRRAGEYVRTNPYTGSTPAELQTWLTGSASPTNSGGLRAFVVNPANSPAPGNSVTSLTAQSATLFTAQSTGAEGAALKVVLQNYEMKPRTLPPGLKPNSGFISRPKIEAGGSSSITTDPSSTVTSVVGNNNLNGSTINVTVGSTSRLKTGDYVKINGSIYRIDSLSANTINATRKITASNPPAKLSGDVGLVLNPVTEQVVGIPNPSPTVLKTTSVTSFRAGELISIGEGLYSRRAKVESFDAALSTLSVSWPNGYPASIEEGTSIIRDVNAMTSASKVTIEPNATNKQNNFYGYVNGVKINDCTTNTLCSGSDNTALNTATGSDFTKFLFGLTDAELNDLVPLTAAPQSPLPDNTNVGIIRIIADDYQNFFKSNRTYSGIIIADGVMTANINGTTINGFVYFRDDVKGTFNGSSTVNGSIAVRGGVENVNNVLSGNIKINYNAVNLQQIFSTSGGSRKYVPVTGTWRQQ